MFTGARIWHTVINDAQLSGLALRTAVELAHRLRDIEILKSAVNRSIEQTKLPVHLVHWQRHSIPEGSAGLAILFEYLDQCSPGEGWDRPGRQHLELAARGAESMGLENVSLFGGLSGVAFAAACLSRGGTRYRGLLSDLNQALVASVSQLANRVNTAEDGVAWHDYDVISGLSGVAACLLLQKDEQIPRSMLDAAMRSLVHLAGDNIDGVPRWFTPVDLMFDEMMARHFPHGGFNLGLAHGIPGCLALLSIAKKYDVLSAGLEEAIGRVGDWVKSNREDDIWGVDWPTIVPRYLPGQDASSTRRKWPTKAAWCYGTPGVARALWLAGQAIDRTDFRDLAVEGMKAVLSRPVLDRHIPSPTFCHGIAGLLHIVLRFAVDTDLPLFYDAAHQLTAQLLTHYNPDSILGFCSIEPDGTTVDNPGLLDGAVGIALVLLAATSDIDPAWDRLFLLS